MPEGTFMKNMDVTPYRAIVNCMAVNHDDITVCTSKHELERDGDSGRECACQIENENVNGFAYICKSERHLHVCLRRCTGTWQRRARRRRAPQGPAIRKMCLVPNTCTFVCSSSRPETIKNMDLFRMWICFPTVSMWQLWCLRICIHHC